MGYNQEYYQQNPERFREYRKRWREAHPTYGEEWYLANRELMLIKGRHWREQNPDYHRQYGKEYYQANSEAIKSSMIEWADDNPEKVVAQNALKVQIRNGSIIRPELCSACGNTGVMAGHHKDYTKPLEIIWLCRSCHKRVHAGTLSLAP